MTGLCTCRTGDAHREASALAERAVIDMMDDHHLFIEDMAETLLRFALAAETEAAALKQRVVALEGALGEIAKQKLHSEITDSDPDEMDWLGGYEECVRVARRARNLGGKP